MLSERQNNDFSRENLIRLRFYCKPRLRGWWKKLHFVTHKSDIGIDNWYRKVKALPMLKCKHACTNIHSDMFLAPLKHINIDHLAFYILSDNIYNKHISVKLLCVSQLHYKPPGLHIEQLSHYMHHPWSHPFIHTFCKHICVLLPKPCIKDFLNTNYVKTSPWTKHTDVIQS